MCAGAPAASRGSRKRKRQENASNVNRHRLRRHAASFGCGYRWPRRSAPSSAGASAVRPSSPVDEFRVVSAGAATAAAVAAGPSLGPLGLGGLERVAPQRRQLVDGRGLGGPDGGC